MGDAHPDGGGKAGELLGVLDSMDESLRRLLPTEELEQKGVDIFDKGSETAAIAGEVERHAAEFLMAAKKLEVYFLALQAEFPQGTVAGLKEEIAMLEAEVAEKDRLLEGLKDRKARWRGLAEGARAPLAKRLSGLD